MIKVISGADESVFPDIFEQAAILRHSVFVDEMGWEDLRRPDGRERDQFDDAYAVHHFCMRNDRVIGYIRMLPTLRPYLLSEVFPDLCEGAPPRAANCYELTRYCVAPAYREGKRGVSSAGSELIAGFVEWGLACGVNRVILEFEPMWVLRAMQLRFLVRPLGFQQKIGDQQIVATEVTFDKRTLATIREFRGHPYPVVEFCGQLAEQIPRQAYAS